MRFRVAFAIHAPALWRRFRQLGTGGVLGVLFCLLAGMLPFAGDCLGTVAGAQPGLTAITETVHRPFPLLVPLSYRWARAAAWLNALKAACLGLPAGARTGLAASGLDDHAGLLVLCAQLYARAHLTPDDSSDVAVTVSLVPTPDVSTAMASAVREADLLAVQRKLLLDLEQTLVTVQRRWPPSLAEARKRAVELDAAALRLDALWLALEAARAAPGGWFCAPEALPALERAVMGAPENAAVWLLLAEARMQRDLPQAAVASASEALKLLENAGKGGHPADGRLAARARYVRGLGHWRLGQPALAEADLGASLQTARPENAPHGEEMARRLRARGAVRMLRRHMDGMCADFAAACALGDCEGLAVARARGHCRSVVPVESPGETAKAAP